MNRNEKIFKKIKSQFKNNIIESYISVNFNNSTSNLSLTDNIHDNNNSSYANEKSNNSNLLQVQSYDKEISTKVKGEGEEMRKKIKLYSRSYTLDDEVKEEEDSGLLVLWIVLGIIGFMSGFIILTYIVNYILYNHRDHLMGNHNPDENYDGTVNPMSLDFMSFGHSPQNLSKKELDQCPIFYFKATNKKHQYKNSNSS
ncbi:hypothetical protein H8356DRAFT_1271115 [Neocallimastix lanati (nom. inval.)]|uniref:Uncharacterized protein n=1 Tax=Neocallimastix californiae TaxID=1754190 RepID=A0A1Y2B831_9FUNG|nr:hypothetical protein H8356DRAFT_1271115 [Neocallimastix sp. JGI-2020a]ORY30265.1 hypothetical protein LY90DRAFT_512682 [Neocallimastix californiae]|eukprot:ORY30265.1 hypothetical protein LY90DRAFT_512682 [Neocallimastix californiae]